ncbi:MAG: potassium channel protein [Acidobacteria bacterium]|nr:MAG: potassium channel protein [Acidobacteriota bacterium]
MARLTAARVRDAGARGRAISWWEGWRFVAILIALVMAGGTVGYVLIEGWSPWDAFYMTVITITTVGYREVHPMSRAGEAFTVVILLSGVGSFFYAFTLFMALLAEGHFIERRLQRKHVRMLDELKDHFILCGFGRMGEIIAREFSRQHVAFVVIERSSDRMQAALEKGFLAVEADASSEDVLRTVRIDRARGFIAAVGTDAENVYAVLSARLLRPDVFIIGRAETEDARVKLRRAGADRVISPYHIGGQQLAQTALRPAVVDFVQLATTSENLELNMEQVHIGEGSPLKGRSLVEAGLRQRFGVVVVGIRRIDGRMDFNPAPETTMRAGDDLVVLGRADSLKELEAAALADARGVQGG